MFSFVVQHIVFHTYTNFVQIKLKEQKEITYTFYQLHSPFFSTPSQSLFVCVFVVCSYMVCALNVWTRYCWSSSKSLFYEKPKIEVAIVKSYLWSHKQLNYLRTHTMALVMLPTGKCGVLCNRHCHIYVSNNIPLYKMLGKQTYTHKKGMKQRKLAMKEEHQQQKSFCFTRLAVFICLM